MAVWVDPWRKPCYLFALVAGDLAVVESAFTTCTGKTVDLRIYAEQKNISRCDFAMESLKRAMKWDEERFGLEYDLDLFNIVAVDDFNMGAMENKSLNLFNSRLVLATADSGDGRRVRAHRGRRRSRVLSQLDRQPRHLPRLVPAVPEGGPDRVQGPGVQQRHG